MITPNRGRGESPQVGIGVAIGAVTTVCATTTDGDRVSVTSRPTSVTIDPDASPVTEFADLGRNPETVSLGGRIFSPATLIAEAVRELVPSDASAVCTHPANYDDKQVAQLRQALDLAGAREVRLLSEPLAAVAWLDHEHGPLSPGRVLVYDLGATSLDVAVVEVGADGERSVVGTPLRSYDFGGRPLGAMIVRYVGDVLGSPRRLPVSLADSDELRAWHVRDSLAVLWECLHAAELGLDDIDRILVVGGASRAPEVSGVLAELGPPVVTAADPGHCVAAGAAWTAVRRSDRTLPPAVVRAGPSLVSAVAALSVLGLSTAALLAPVPGSGELWRQSPAIDGMPHAQAPQGPGGENHPPVAIPDLMSATVGDAASGPAPASPTGEPLPAMASPAPRSTESTPCPDAPGAMGGPYADPSRFENPLPFDPAAAAPAPIRRAEPFGPTGGSDSPATNFSPPTPPSGQSGSTPPAGQGGSTPTDQPTTRTTPGGGGTAPTGTDPAGQGPATGGGSGTTGDTTGGQSGSTPGGSTGGPPTGTGGTTTPDHTPPAGGPPTVPGPVGGGPVGGGGLAGGGIHPSGGGFGGFVGH
ncbi:MULTISPECIES: Hsp70 family protein [Nocardia]|uniref:Hsp70 family protein n=1 Tax=Nocardia TaxID=1817 RepID=UPI00255C65B7|nr:MULTISPECIES: Hsp70 family protein [Nocardia]